jgi:hypothetical protein
MIRAILGMGNMRLLWMDYVKGEIRMMSVRSNSCKFSGLKSRLGSCPYTPVVQGSGV